MSRFACAGTLVLLAAIAAAPLEAQERRPSLGKAIATGALTGAAHVLLPQRRGWKKYAQTTAVGLVASGLAFWGLGHLNGNVGPMHPGDFRNVGLGHGGIAGAIVVRFGG